jgi:hypothetical protein
MADFYGWRRPPALWSWDACGASDVTDSPSIAAGHVADELAGAPAGAEGCVHRVKLIGGVHLDLGEVARARRDGRGVWRAGVQR